MFSQLKIKHISNPLRKLHVLFLFSFFFSHPVLYFNLSFIYIHIEFVMCHMLPDVVKGYRPDSSFPFLEAAEQIHLYLF